MADVFVKTVTLSDDTKVVCYDLHYSYLFGVENGEIIETKHGIVEDGTDMNEDEVMKLRNSDMNLLHDTIVRLTYPQLYNEDGSPKEIPVDEDDGDTKKKA